LGAHIDKALSAYIAGRPHEHMSQSKEEDAIRIEASKQLKKGV